MPQPATFARAGVASHTRRSGAARSGVSDRLTGVEGTDRPTRWVLVLRVVGAASAAALALAVAGSVLSFMSKSQGAAETLAGLAFLAVFPLWATLLVASAATRRRSGSRGWSDLISVADDDQSWREAIPDRLLLVVLVCWLVLGAGALVGISALAGGAPEQQGDRYVRNNHGELTTITADEYDRAVGAQVRLFSAVAAVFLGVAAISATTRSAQLEARREPSEAHTVRHQP